MRYGVRSLRDSWCRAECAPGRTQAAEGNGWRQIVCTRNRTDPISGCAKNGDAPDAIGVVARIEQRRFNGSQAAGLIE